MKKCASLHLRDGRVFISASSRTKDGFWIDTGAIRIAESDDLDAVTEGTRSALNNSRHGVPTPSPGEDLTGPMLAAAGVKSWRTFVSRAKVVDVCSSDGLAIITPYKKVTSNGNYEPQTEKSRTCRVASVDLGATILEAFVDAS